MVWFLEKSSKQGGDFQPNWPRLLKLLKLKKKQDVINQVITKVKKIDPRAVRRDLEPFIADANYLDQFEGHYADIIERELSKLIV